MDFTLFRPKRVWESLEGYPDRPHLRTVSRWCSGQIAPPSWAVEVIRQRVVAETKEAPSPEWARGLESRIVDEIVANREELRKLVESQSLAATGQLTDAMRTMMDEALAAIAGRTPSQLIEDPAPSDNSPGGAARGRRPARRRV